MTQKMKITYSNGSTKIEDKVMKIEPYIEEPKKIYANWDCGIGNYCFQHFSISPENKGGFTEKEALISRLYMVINDWGKDPKEFEMQHYHLVKELALRL